MWKKRSQMMSQALGAPAAGKGRSQSRPRRFRPAVERLEGRAVPANNGDMVGTAANPIDPGLAPLANNGGLTRTHSLLAGRPAIDRGGSSGAPATDQRGVGRR